MKNVEVVKANTLVREANYLGVKISVMYFLSAIYYNNSSDGYNYCLFLFHREKLFKQSLSNLKVEVVKANTLVREANYLAVKIPVMYFFSAI